MIDMGRPLADASCSYGACSITKKFRKVWCKFDIVVFVYRASRAVHKEKEEMVEHHKLEIS